MIERNYDETPIIIKDKLPEVSFYIFMIVFLFSIIIGISIGVVFNEDGVNWAYLISYIFFMYTSLVLFNYFKIKKNSYIKIFENKIIREWNDEVLTIELNNLSAIKKAI
jgi:purine-cytosine permease-like protein